MNVSITGRKFVLTLLQLDCGFLSSTFLLLCSGQSRQPVPEHHWNCSNELVLRELFSPEMKGFDVERYSATLTVMGLQSLSNLLLLDNEKGGEDHSKDVNNELLVVQN